MKNTEKGPIFCQLLLADEINRASPRTQSALLQAMQENCEVAIWKLENTWRFGNIKAIGEIWNGKKSSAKSEYLEFEMRA